MVFALDTTKSIPSKNIFSFTLSQFSTFEELRAFESYYESHIKGSIGKITGDTTLEFTIQGTQSTDDELRACVRGFIIHIVEGIKVSENLGNCKVRLVFEFTV